MNQITRRALLQGLGATPLVFASPRNAFAAASRIRYDAASPEGMQMLEVYADAVRAMQALGPKNPMCWLWQWYTHFVNGSTTKSKELTRIFGSGTSSLKTLASDTWNTCQSHSGQDANHFLPWHRMYVYYFERIVRRVSGRDDFTLPYWDYTSEDPAKRGILPEPFRLPDDPVFGVLYRPDRSTLANSGARIDENQPRDMMDIDSAMAKADYSTAGSVTGFCAAINSGIHGRIRTLVGTSKDMGSVPYAAKDPLFWVHHANIDRLWASWNQSGGINPASASWSYHQFVFADAGGVRVKKPLRAFFSTDTLGYGYDALITPQATTLAATASASQVMATRDAGAQGAVAQRIATARGGVELGARPVQVLLRAVPGGPESGVLGLDPADSGRHAYLVLRELHTWAQPGVLFHLYLSAPGTAPQLDAPHYAGSITFFDAQFHDHGGGSPLDMALGENLYSFDVTALLQAMRREGTTSARDALMLTVTPGGTPAGGSPLIGSIELVRQ